MRKVLFVFICVFASVGLYAGGSSEAALETVDSTESYLTPIPKMYEIPRLPDVLRNEEDLTEVVDAYLLLIDDLDPLIESLAYNGLEANREVLDSLKIVTEWWRDYITALKIRADSPSLKGQSIDAFFSRLVAADTVLEEKLARINHIIDLENGNT